MSEFFLVVAWPERFQHVDIQPIIKAIIGSGINVYTRFGEDGLVCDGSVVEARKLPELQRQFVRVYDLKEPERLRDLIYERPDFGAVVEFWENQQRVINNPCPPLSDEEARELQVAIHAEGNVGP